MPTHARNTHVHEELASQPACWRRACELAPAVTGLPEPGERIAVVGCGTSLYMAQSYAALREASGHGETDAFAASEMPVGRIYDRVLALTRSGTTTEVVELLKRTTLPTTVVTGDPDAPAAGLAHQAVLMPFADEKSVVQTRFATTTLALLRAHLGEDLTAAIADAQDAVEGPLPDGLADRTQFTFLGTGWTVGLANEAALKLREAALSWSESYPAMEYRHGPIAVTDARSAVWMFGSAPQGLAEQVAATGGRWFAQDTDPLAALIQAQRLGLALADRKELDPDRPRHLTRSVILDAQPSKETAR